MYTAALSLPLAPKADKLVIDRELLRVEVLLGAISPEVKEFWKKFYGKMMVRKFKILKA